jgi:hypothetical protein
MTTLTQYRCRAECEADITCFLAYLTALDMAPANVKIDPSEILADCELSFSSPLSLTLLRTLAWQCPLRRGVELHVLYESLETEEAYTGDRVSLEILRGVVREA